MGRITQLIAWVGILVAFATAQDKTADGIQGRTDIKSHPESSSRSERYLDARERKAATLTFKWRTVRETTKTLLRDAEKPLQVSEGVVQ